MMTYEVTEKSLDFDEMKISDLCGLFVGLKRAYMQYPDNIDLIDALKSVLDELDSRNAVYNKSDSFIQTIVRYPIDIENLLNPQEEVETSMAPEEDEVMEVEYSVNIEKIDEDQQLVFGWAYVSEVNGETFVDSHGDSISEEELEKAFYDYVIHARNAGEMHIDKRVGTLVECMVFTKEKQKALGIDLGKVGAWVGFKLNQETYQKVKSGEYPQLSIGGLARVLVDE